VYAAQPAERKERIIHGDLSQKDARTETCSCETVYASGCSGIITHAAEESDVVLKSEPVFRAKRAVRPVVDRCDNVLRQQAVIKNGVRHTRADGERKPLFGLFEFQRAAA